MPRKQGVPNKITADVKAMILGALSDLGGRAWLVEAAQDNKAAFMSLLGKLIPRDLHLSGEVRHTLEHTIAASYEQQPRALDRVPESRVAH